MRVLFVYPSTYPWDVRVEKIATSLREQGHRVHLLSANFDRRESREELNGMVVHRLPRLPRWAGPLQVAVSLPSPCNPVWFFAMRYLLGRQRFDVMIVRDLQVALAAIAAGRLAGVPVVLDLAENWPALLREWRHHEGWTLQNLLLRHPSPAGVIERLSIRHADHVIVVVEEMRDRLANELHVSPARISVVMNTPTYRSYVQREKEGDRLVLVYLGEVHASRGLELAIRALALVLRRSGQARLRIIGRGKPAQERRLRDLAEKLGILKEVQFVEWMPQQEALRVAAEADIGLCPFPASALNDTTISTK
jgi:glycosyltransferase involved in cell wall biosynthesis